MCLSSNRLRLVYNIISLFYHIPFDVNQHNIKRLTRRTLLWEFERIKLVHKLFQVFHLVMNIQQDEEHFNNIYILDSTNCSFNHLLETKSPIKHFDKDGGIILSEKICNV